MHKAFFSPTTYPLVMIRINYLYEGGESSLTFWFLVSQNWTLDETHSVSLVELLSSENQDIYMCRVYSSRDRKHNFPRWITERMVSGTLIFTVLFLIPYCYLLRKQNYIIVTDFRVYTKSWRLVLQCRAVSLAADLKGHLLNVWDQKPLGGVVFDRVSGFYHCLHTAAPPLL